MVGLRPRNPATKLLGRHRRSPHNALQSPDLDPNAHDPLHRSRYTTSTDMTLLTSGRPPSMGRSNDQEDLLSEPRKYRKFSAQQKTELVLAALKGHKTIAELARERDISETL